MEGASVDGYRAPLFVAWQLTNRCSARCLACCEESGPDKAWVDELSRVDALGLVQRIVDADIPYVAFGGGEPLGVPHCWELFELLSNAGIALKIETDGQHIDARAADRLAALDVQCIQISVDGATPDHELAAEFGMRYVHVPIRYSGIEQGELTALTKTFRELEGPFFVHCFHGKHRGPAAAAVGRLTLDSVDRRVALAEMRQWSGTSEKYDGLYSAVAFAELPDPATTSRFEFDFPAAHAFDGFREAMVHMAREHDVLIALADRGWEAHPDHPDWDGRNAATKLADILAQTHTMQEVLDEDSEYQGWLVSSEQMSRQIADLLGRVDQGDREAAAPAAKLVGELKNTCNRCHSGYRN